MSTATKKDQRYTLINETAIRLSPGKKMVRTGALILSIILEGFVLHFCYKHDLFKEPMIPALSLVPVLIMAIKTLDSTLEGGLCLNFRRLELIVKLFFSLSIAMLILKMLLIPSLQGLIDSLRIVGIYSLISALMIVLNYTLKLFKDDYICEIKFTGNLLGLVKDLRSIGFNLAKKEDNLICFHTGKWSISTHECIAQDYGKHYILLADKYLKNKLREKGYA